MVSNYYYNIDRLTNDKDETYFTYLQKYQHKYSDEKSELPLYCFKKIVNLTVHGAVNMSQLKIFH